MQLDEQRGLRRERGQELLIATLQYRSGLYRRVGAGALDMDFRGRCHAASSWIARSLSKLFRQTE
ncbi:hypothetical protein [Pseudonocardia sp. GCM10023141]|uniref:hypothetical protein n=1 Tax=Pseudonocardia sp. GCM10023141 TaxID=3252653 RepID=UPI0036145834